MGGQPQGGIVVSMDRVLTQQEIDSVFQKLRGKRGPRQAAYVVTPYDFRRPDRIPKDQLRAIHALHETFARSVASSLSAYLRAYVITNLVAVEQLSFQEFSQSLPSPTVLIALNLQPLEGRAVLELNPALVFPILEMMLGGGAVPAPLPEREITEIEKNILDGVVRIILQDLREAWRTVADLSFDVVGYETEPQLLQGLGPHEAVVAVSMEVRLGDHSGMLNLAIPSVVVKMLRQRFSQKWAVRRVGKEDERERLFKLLQRAEVQLDVRLEGGRLSLAGILQLAPGDIIVFDYPVEKPVGVFLNGRLRYEGSLASTGRKLAVRLGRLIAPGE